MKHSEFVEQLSHKIGFSASPSTMTPVGGGCIHRAECWDFGKEGKVFVKQNSVEAAEMLRTEFDALNVLKANGKVRCPSPIYYECDPKAGAFLVLEHLELVGLNTMSAEALGRDLAELHSVSDNLYGWKEHNFIGATKQLNNEMSSWSEFFWVQRLFPQLKWAGEKGFSFGKITALESSVEKALDSHSPAASLLHGDLWGGNAAAFTDGCPVLFDPACYYGDAETDLAFTEVFGGFPSSFYDAYWEVSGLDAAAYSERKDIYNLYHYLNHLNLFGAGYLGRCQSIISQTLNRYGSK